MVTQSVTVGKTITGARERGERMAGDSPSQDEKPLLLVDGSSYLFRAFYALPDLKTTKGFHTGLRYRIP